jgi:hypothetical protein
MSEAFFIGIGCAFLYLSFGMAYAAKISEIKESQNEDGISDNGMPNWFWRTMQYLLFGFKWRESK